MLKNYLKIALRNLRKYKAYSFINIAGLALGIGSALLIWLYVQDELSYDRFHPKAQHTYRLLSEGVGSGLHTNTPPALAAAFKNDYPEIRHIARVFQHWFSPLIAHEQKGFIEERFFFVDSSFFEVFSLTLLKGDSRRVLQSPNAVVLTESMAQKYFGDTDPIGQTLTYNTNAELKVTGILRAPPHNMHFHPDFLASISSLRNVMWPAVLDSWTMNALKTYVVLNENASAAALQKKMLDFYPRHLGEGGQAKLHLQPITDIHLRSQLPYEIEPNSDQRYVYLLLAIAAIILTIAGINYVNLATARSAVRAKEVGMRKVAGAQRFHLIGQFLGESILLALAALILAAGLLELLLPYVNQFTGKKLALDFGGNASWLVFILGATFGIGVIAGSYPALFLSRLQPVKVLKGRIDAGSTGGAMLRRSLVVIQFAASVILIIGTLVIGKQLDYFRSAKLGFNKAQVLVVPVQDKAVSEQLQALRSELLRHSSVLAAGSINTFPGKVHVRDPIRWEGVAEEQSMMMSINWIDFDLAATLGLEFVAGRGFSREHETDATEAVILNETAVKALGWESPEAALGKKIFSFSTDRPEGRRIIGVVGDFHFQSLHHAIEPLVIYPRPANLTYLLVRIRPQNIAGTLATMAGIWSKFSARQPFTHSFLDQDFDRLYNSEQRLSRLMSYAASTAILIACLGLFGLASFMVERRTKEIGIRKVLGASVSQVVILLSKDFTRLVLIALIIAAPVAYLAMSRWLQDFAYRINIGWWVFALAGGLAFLIALLTVSSQAIKAALANPVEALRYE